MRNVGLNELQAGIKKDRRNNNLRYADDNTLMAESKKEQKNLLVSVKEESEKAGLKINIKINYDHGIWSHYFMANKKGKYGNSDRFPVLVQSATVSMSPIPVRAKLRLCLPASKQQIVSLVPLSIYQLQEGMPPQFSKWHSPLWDKAWVFGVLPEGRMSQLPGDSLPSSSLFAGGLAFRAPWVLLGLPWWHR